ncbi:hypothetical protein FY534_13905 (plasmid) [Alicyclobacillus sp. TC]|uniref:Uncharacterized protein n=1 Tax=Alicyclobacillus tolerans TaxID=90970 RepID=A0ABT9LYM3_9BACL|nr:MULTISPECIES: hypothetical protein [Alicyclobacillus]MDP9729373.1 hypothetical protein [Alicyclobacillus tengchongensis]QRF24868.1 hypothetical protein FY534_13905 [Alicyclobacillus sp. TC]
MEGKVFNAKKICNAFQKSDYFIAAGEDSTYLQSRDYAKDMMENLKKITNVLGHDFERENIAVMVKYQSDEGWRPIHGIKDPNLRLLPILELTERQELEASELIDIGDHILKGYPSLVHAQEEIELKLSEKGTSKKSALRRYKTQLDEFITMIRAFIDRDELAQLLDLYYIQKCSRTSCSMYLNISDSTVDRMQKELKFKVGRGVWLMMTPAKRKTLLQLTMSLRQEKESPSSKKREKFHPMLFDVER